jgi:hypothetical protein
MHSQTVWANPKPKRDGLAKTLLSTQIHSLTAIVLVTLMGTLSMTFGAHLIIETSTTANVVSFFDQFPTHANPKVAGANFSFDHVRSIDVMKYTKDLVRNQQSDSEINAIVSAIANGLHPTHIAISVPMDESEAYPNPKPAPRTAAEFTKAWADAIHSQGINIIWRGTWSGLEGLYNFPKQVGTNRFPTGTVESAATDGETTWLGKTYDYIINHPDFFESGDIWAPLPERTEDIFQDSTSFLPYSSPGIQANYVAFYNDLKIVSDEAFQQIGKTVMTGWTANNYTEAASGWLDNSLFDTAGIISIDHYGGTHTVSEMESNLRDLYEQKHHPIFLQEWGDYWNQKLDLPNRIAYLLDMYGMLEQLSDEGILTGFNYWGGWDNSAEGILKKVGSQYQLNERGIILAGFFNPESNKEQDILEDSTTPPSSNSRGAGGGSGSISPAPQPNNIQGIDKKEVKNLPYPTGTLVNDQGTIYLISGALRIPFTNFDAFVGLGFSAQPTVYGDTSMYEKPETYKLENSEQQHPWGSWLINKGIVYYSTDGGLIGVPNMEVFSSNGGKFIQILQANTADLTVISGDTLKMNDERIIK